MKCFATMLGLMLTIGLHAAEKTVAKITSDLDKNTTELRLITDEVSTIESLRFVTTSQTGQVTADDIFPVDQMIAEGIVIVERDGRDILRIKGLNFSPRTGGEVKLDFLFSGIRESRKSIKLVLKDSVLFSPLGEKVNKLLIKANRSPILGIIGIREIRTSFIKD